MLKRVKWSGGLVLAIAISSATGADERLYRWMDDQGQVHYGDAPPDRPYRALEIDSAPEASGGAGDNPYSVLNQAKAMEAERLERERRRQAEETMRLERRRQLLETEAAAARAEAARQAIQVEKKTYFAHPLPHPPPPRPVKPRPDPEQAPPRRARQGQRSLMPATRSLKPAR